MSVLLMTVNNEHKTNKQSLNKRTKQNITDGKAAELNINREGALSESFLDSSIAFAVVRAGFRVFHLKFNFQEKEQRERNKFVSVKHVFGLQAPCLTSTLLRTSKKDMHTAGAMVSIIHYGA